jgi:predicted RNase H-like nuclease (RuvC/YqgF family)
MSKKQKNMSDIIQVGGEKNAASGSGVATVNSSEQIEQINIDVENQIKNTLNLIENQSIEIKNLSERIESFQNRNNELGKEIAELKEQIQNKNSKTKMLPKWVYWVWLVSLASFGLSISCIFFGYNIKWNVEIVSTSIILTFVGVLATFVVVSNYAQTKDIQRDFENKVKEIKEQFGDIEKKLLDQIDEKIKIKIEHREDIEAVMFYSLISFILRINEESKKSPDEESQKSPDEEDYTESLDYAMMSMRIINRINDKEIPGYLSALVHSNISMLLLNNAHIKKIQLSSAYKSLYIEILNDCKDSDKDKFIEAIKNITAR